ncbi:C40 family peptidase [Yeosuana sp. MJ-SS3]|uniref:C40 family peptidase n=1 Tax=Gilvirhabdus luticola TaxID=3079858 RepID=A0ABU3U4D7_9FLAO|nr:C40 family peptidase [Yeosuana sp. MJ-SS3]MDU8885179.1 C40 family peptidase [Yeosuana sp. MJ-SS3]
MVKAIQRKLFLVSLLILFLGSCKSSKRAVSKSSKSTSEEIILTRDSTLKVNELANKVVDYAKQFNGVKYKYGGNTKRGMDCSGLISTSFGSEKILLPRTTSDLSKTGQWIDLKEVEKGDLLFFATKKNSRKVNHVAIVTEARTGYVEFIHSTTSAGVIVSNLEEKYWYFAFVQARRVF